MSSSEGQRSFWARMQSLGTLRCRILSCLGADNPKLAAFFDPPEDRPLADSLQHHLLNLHQAFTYDPESQRIVAAGLLTFGELERAEEILSVFPREPIRMDHGAGWCPLVAYSTVAALLPLPRDNQRAVRWVDGSPEALAVSRWFRAHKDQLRWDESLGKFILT